MKLRKQDVNLLIAVIGILIAVCCYFFVYTKLNDKTEVLEAENAALQQEVDRLQELEDNKQEYLDKTAAMNEEMTEIKSHFAPAYRAEDQILYVDSIEKTFSTDVSAVGMPGSSMIEVAYTAPEIVTADSAVAQTEEAAEGEAAEGEEAAPEEAAPAPAATPDNYLYCSPVSISFIASYASIKDVIKALNEDNMRKSIDAVSLSFDGETGDLAGSMSFKMYSMTGTDAVYETPVITNVPAGTGNIFNSAEKKSAVQAAKAEAAAAQNAESAE